MRTTYGNSAWAESCLTAVCKVSGPAPDWGRHIGPSLGRLTVPFSWGPWLGQAHSMATVGKTASTTWRFDMYGALNDLER